MNPKYVAQQLWQNDLMNARAWVWPLLYLTWAIPLVVIIALLAPPFQNPDEPAHMHRAVQLEQGGLFGYRYTLPGNPILAGGLSDYGIEQAAGPLADLSFHYERKVTAAALAASNAIRFGYRVDSAFPNTAMYPPFFYVIQAACVKLAKIADLAIDRTLQLIRIVNATVAAVVTALALLIARRCRPAIMAVGMLPMTISVFATPSQDGMIISLILVCVALADNAFEELKPLSDKSLNFVTFALAMISMARPPYVALAFLLPVMAPSTRGWLRAGFVIAATIIYSGLVGKYISVTFREANPPAQIAFILSDMVFFIGLLYQTVELHWTQYWRETIGVLGFADAPLPEWYLKSAMTALIVAFIGTMAGRARFRLLPIVATSGATVAIFTSIYIIWDAPRALAIENAQGRYFTPLLVVVALALPALPIRFHAIQCGIACMALVFLATSTPAVMVGTILRRYYLFP